MTDDRQYDALSLGMLGDAAPAASQSGCHTSSPLNQLGTALVQSTNSDQFLTLAEGYLKICCVKAALSLGWKLQEGARNRRARGGGMEDMADYLWLTDGILKSKRDVRTLAIANGSTDVTVVEPHELFLELKTRPDLGAKSLAQYEEISKDIERVSLKRRCAFLFVFDKQLYRSFSNDKDTYAGRPPGESSAWFHQYFPQLGNLTPASPKSIGCQFGDKVIEMNFWLQKLPNNRRRIICMGARKDSAWLTISAAATTESTPINETPVNHKSE